MNSDYVFIFLIFLIILLFYLAIKYFKYLLFYLGIFTWILIWTFGKIFLEDKNYNLWFLNNFFKNISDFFSDSKIVEFLWKNAWYLFLLFLILVFHRFFYYLLLILLHFLKWFITSILVWITNKREKKIWENNLENDIQKNSQN